MAKQRRSGATRIIQGVMNFQKRIFSSKQSLFQRLGKGQTPLALFITCSDSRINPNLLTQTEPGELFILRNAGNIVPPHGLASGEEATVEYALKHLHIGDIILCGHSQCGAMQGLLTPHALDDVPAVVQWLSHARDVLSFVDAKLPMHDQLNLAVERNVLLQLGHLQTYPAVAEASANHMVRLHAWVYHIETGEVVATDPGQERFVSLSKAAHQPWLERSSAATPHVPEATNSI